MNNIIKPLPFYIVLKILRRCKGSTLNKLLNICVRQYEVVLELEDEELDLYLHSNENIYEEFVQMITFQQLDMVQRIKQFPEVIRPKNVREFYAIGEWQSVQYIKPTFLTDFKYRRRDITVLDEQGEEMRVCTYRIQTSDMTINIIMVETFFSNMIYQIYYHMIKMERLLRFLELLILDPQNQPKVYRAVRAEYGFVRSSFWLIKFINAMGFKVRRPSDTLMQDMLKTALLRLHFLHLKANKSLNMYRDLSSQMSHLNRLNNIAINSRRLVWKIYCISRILWLFRKKRLLKIKERIAEVDSQFTNLGKRFNYDIVLPGLDLHTELKRAVTNFNFDDVDEVDDDIRPLARGDTFFERETLFDRIRDDAETVFWEEVKDFMLSNCFVVCLDKPSNGFLTLLDCESVPVYHQQFWNYMFIAEREPNPYCLKFVDFESWEERRFKKDRKLLTSGNLVKLESHVVSFHSYLKSHAKKSLRDLTMLFKNILEYLSWKDILNLRYKLGMEFDLFDFIHKAKEYLWYTLDIWKIIQQISDYSFRFSDEMGRRMKKFRYIYFKSGNTLKQIYYIAMISIVSEIASLCTREYGDYQHRMFNRLDESRQFNDAMFKWHCEMYFFKFNEKYDPHKPIHIKTNFRGNMIADVAEKEQESDQEEAQSAEIDSSEDEEVSDIDWEESPVEEVCCYSSKIDNNYAQLQNLMKQFEGKKPDINCLLFHIELATNVLNSIDSATKLTQKMIDYIDEFKRFRHDVFGYICLSTLESVPFGTDADLTRYINSKKTPDAIIVKGKTVDIYEFSVVKRRPIGNYLKTNQDKPKYYKEIEMFEDQGYQVQYFPVIYCNTESTEENMKSFESLGLDFSSVKEEINAFSNSLQPALDYLFSFTFDKRYGKDYPLASEKIENDLTEKTWDYRMVEVNRVKFFDLRNCVRDCLKAFPEQELFALINTRGKIKMRPTQSNKGSYSLKDLTDSLDDFALYKKFNKFLKGKDRVLIKTEMADDFEFEVKLHGKVMEIETDSASFSQSNPFKLGFISTEEEERLSQLILNEKMQGLINENKKEDILDSLKIYENNLNLYSKPNPNVNPPIKNDPRESFLCLPSTDLIEDIPYYEGPKFKFLNPKLFDGSVCLVINSDGYKKLSYEYVKAQDDTESKIKMRNSWQNIYLFLKEKKLETKKVKTALTILKGADREKLLDLAEENRQLVKDSLIKNAPRKGPLLKLTSDMKAEIKSEMNWKGNQGFKVYMGKKRDLTILSTIMKTKIKGLNLRFELPKNVDDSPFLVGLKEKCIDELNHCKSILEKTLLFQTSIFYSRLAYTLLATSNMTFNSDRMWVDNIGCTDCILLIKGGKKITTTRMTKIFKFICPTYRAATDYSEHVKTQGSQRYQDLPWMQLKQEVLSDMLSLPYKILSNFVYVMEKSNSPDSALDCIMMPTLLAFHNRRKTEIQLHNMRYLVVNAMGDYSQVGKMLEEFAGPGYSAFDFSIYRGLLDNYLEFYDGLRKWVDGGVLTDDSIRVCNIKHPFLNKLICSIDELIYIIYSTYMMSRGHYDHKIEQGNNLNDILKTHQDYIGNPPKNLNNLQTEEDIREMKTNDFSYSPNWSYMIGKCIAAEIKFKKATVKLQHNWSNLMREPVDNFANNKGLRYKGKDFFGHKGYYVVYKELIEKHFDKLKTLLNEMDDVKFKKGLIEINQTIETEQATTQLDQVIFSIVDKTQKGGRREIYVMDYTTKLYQNPLEKMFKFICELIDNEIISIPAARRAGLIHKRNFEYTSEKYTTYYLTFDCRKWAPRSNPEKYYYFILGMIDCLPTDFTLYFVDYFEKHKNKQIHVPKRISELLKSNKNREGLVNHLTIDDEKESAYFHMPYSFVMGIFNMLSSCFHAGLQTLISNKLSMEAGNRGVNLLLHLDAHSDDSAGNICVANNIGKKDVIKWVEYSLSTYEFAQKCGNHMMSVKKCNISKNYFELLSILYLFKQMVPVLPKFLGTVKINPTGLGISADFKQVISKSIELLNNGATSSLCYKVQIIMSNMYRRFYNVHFEERLPTLGGFVNSWPDLYRALGSSIDELRLYRYNVVDLRKWFTFAEEELSSEETDGLPNVVNRVYGKLPNYFKTVKQQINLPDIGEETNWFFSQNKTRHSILNIFWFRAMLNSTNFGVSLLNINEMKRLFDSVLGATSRNIMTEKRYYTILELLRTIELTTPRETKYEKMLLSNNRNAIKFYDWLDNLPNATFNRKIEHSMKPGTISINNTTTLPIMEGNALHIAVEICKPELQKYTFSNKWYGKELETTKEVLNQYDVPKTMKNVKSFIDFQRKHANKVINYISSIPSNQRVMEGLDGVIQVMISNFSRNCDIGKMSSRFVDHSYYETATSERLFDIVTASKLFYLYRDTRIEELGELTVNLGDELYLVRNINNYVYKNTTPDFFNWFKMIERSEPTPINFQSINMFAFWLERQTKINEEWVGKGKLYIKIGNNPIIVTVKNRTILKVEHNIIVQQSLTEIESQFLSLLFKHNNLNLKSADEVPNSVITLGVDINRNWKLAKPNDLMMAVGEGVLNVQPKRTLTGVNEFVHDKSRSMIRMGKLSYTIETLFSLVAKERTLTPLDLLDFGLLDNNTKKNFIKRALGGRFSQDVKFKFDRSTLIQQICSSELYRMVVEKMKPMNTKFSTIFLEDLKTEGVLNEDIYKNLFDSLGIDQSVDLLSDEHKDKIRILLYFKTDDKAIIQFREKIKESNLKEKSEIARIMRGFGGDMQLLNLPEIGDESEFEKFDVPSGYQDTLHAPIEAARAIIVPLSEGAKQLTPYVISRLQKKYGMTTIDKNTIVQIFHNISSDSDYRLYTDMRTLQVEHYFLHNLLEAIFEDHNALAEFSLNSRQGILKPLPKHPTYKNNWQILLKNIFKMMTKTQKFATELKNEFPKAKDVKSMKYNNKSFLKIEKEIDADPLIPLEHLTRIYEDLSIPITDVLGEGGLDLKSGKTESTALHEVLLDYSDSFRKRKRHNFSNKSEFVWLKNFDDVYAFAEMYKEEESPAIITTVFLPDVPKTPIKINVGYDVGAYIYNMDHCIAEPFFPQQSYYELYQTEIEYKLIKELDEKKVADIRSLQIPKDHFKIQKDIDIQSHSTYNESLLEALSNHFSLNADNRNEIRKIFYSNMTPLEKWEKSISFCKNAKKDDWDELIEGVLEEKESKIEKGVDLILKLDNLDEIFISLGSLGVEFEQLNTLLSGFASNLLSGKIKMSRGLKKYAIKELKLLLRQSKGNNKLGAMISIILRCFNDIIEGETNDNGRKFDEVIREYLSDFIDEIDDVDLEDLMPEANYDGGDGEYLIG